VGTRSNQDRSKEIAQLVRNWIAEREAHGDYPEWIQTSGPTALKGVKRKELAEALGVSKTSLNENESSAELRNAEFRWCWEYREKQETSKAANAELKRARSGEKNAQKRASSLEGDNSALKAENRLLRNRLAKWEAIDRVLQETARAPRMPYTEE
jgi:hypothetical protein